MPRAEKLRLDQLLFDRGLAASREKARALILAGQVLVDGQKSDKPGHSISGEARIEVLERMPYASRGGLKLAAALDHFAIDVTGLHCIDIGSSTGGFTDCLLQRGAADVWCIDVGHGQLDWKLRNDPRVTVRESANARYLRVLRTTDVGEHAGRGSSLDVAAAQDAGFRSCDRGSFVAESVGEA